MSSHDHYEELCALAAAGQISPSQWSDLEAHVGHCPDCRQTLRDFEAVAIELTKVGFERDSTEDIPAGMIDRVVERVGSQTSARLNDSNGWHSPDPRFSVSQPRIVRLNLRRGSVARKYIYAAAMASVVIAAFVLGARWEHQRLQSQSLHAHEAIGAETERSNATGGEVDQLRNQLQNLGARASQLSALLHRREQDLATGRQREADLEARIDALNRSRAASERSNDNEEVSRLRQELEHARSESEANRKDAALAEAEIQQLRTTVKVVSKDLVEAARLNATSKEVRDLLTDPNVHVWNVHDIDEKGRPRRAFGRIIYAEGKRLTFYAFDLVDQQHQNDQSSFYVWGETSGTQRPVRMLGVLKIDDAKAGRWKIAIDNSEVLAGVDGIFVTAGSGEGLANEPRGKRMLFANLDPNANHP